MTVFSFRVQVDVGSMTDDEEIEVRLREAKLELELAEDAYLALRELGAAPQEATDMTDLNVSWGRFAKLFAIAEKAGKAR